MKFSAHQGALTPSPNNETLSRGLSMFGCMSSKVFKVDGQPSTVGVRRFLAGC